MTYTTEEIVIANKTCRASSAIGQTAVVPKYVRQYAKQSDSILDFGAGKQAIHTQQLITEGYNVSAYEFGNNYTEGLHDFEALSKEYDVVFASNVLNVQSTARMLGLTVLQLKRAMKEDGILIVNYPLEPRKLPLGSKQMEQYLLLHFSKVEIVNEHKNRPVFLIRK